MRQPSENKARQCPTCGHATDVPPSCPECGRATSMRGCRPVLFGWYCVAKGLVVDPDALIVPEPDPAHAAAAADPDVVALGSKVTEAAAAFGEADQAWRTAVLARAEFERKGVRAVDAVMMMRGELQPLPAGTWARRRELDRAVRAAYAAREEAGENLRAARVAHASTLTRALAHAKSDLAAAR